MCYELFLYPSQREALRDFVDTLDPALRRSLMTAELQSIYRLDPTIDPETLGYLATCNPTLIETLRALERQEVLQCSM